MKKRDRKSEPKSTKPEKAKRLVVRSSVRAGKLRHDTV